ncbi:MAG: TetR/AcrR family transcriptional regulator [Clostridia bacterium]|nr:TetR/AcrR family transcriptional regulator [Clostridia bacterium]
MDNKERILLSAKKLFFENGYDQTKTKSIAEDAGVSEALVFKHYKNKENLLFAVLKETIVSFKAESQSLIDYLMNDIAPAEEKLKVFINNRIDFLKRHYMPITIILRQMQFDQRVMKEVLLILKEKIIPIIHKVVTDWYLENHLDQKTQETCEKMILSLFSDLLLQKSIFKMPNEEDFIFEKLDLILKGVRYEKLH